MGPNRGLWCSTVNITLVSVACANDQKEQLHADRCFSPLSFFLFSFFLWPADRLGAAEHQCEPPSFAVATIARSYIVLQLRRCVPGIGSKQTRRCRLQSQGDCESRSCVFRHVTSSDQSAGWVGLTKPNFCGTTNAFRGVGGFGVGKNNIGATRVGWARDSIRFV